jgi:hypothetical protein
MTNTTAPSSIALMPDLEAAWQDVDISFDRFCLVAGIGATKQVMREDAPHPPQRKAVAKCCHGIALDRRRHAGGSQRLPPSESA